MSVMNVEKSELKRSEHDHDKREAGLESLSSSRREALRGLKVGGLNESGLRREVAVR